MTAPGHRLRMQLDGPICTSGKRPFATEELARAELGKAQWRRRQGPGYKPGRVETRTYECPACGAWHLTAKAKR